MNKSTNAPASAKQPKSNGVDEKVPAFKKSSKNKGKGAPARPATFTNRNNKGSGISNSPAYHKK